MTQTDKIIRNLEKSKRNIKVAIVFAVVAILEQIFFALYHPWRNH